MGGANRQKKASPAGPKRTTKARVKYGSGESSEERDRAQQVLKEPNRRGLKMVGANRQKKASPAGPKRITKTRVKRENTGGLG
jgi:hypothetical protein